MSDLKATVWRDIMAYMRRRHAPICRQWFDDLQPTELDGGLLQIQTSNTIQQNYLQKKCVSQFTEAAQAATGALVGVRFVNGQELEPEVADLTMQASADVVTKENNPTDTAAKPAQARSTVTVNQMANTADYETDYDQIVLSPDYSFDNFITGPGNQLAYAASVAVANKPGVAYNPLFVHGGVGLGKTHLLQAICQTIIRDSPQMQICYLSCDTFMNHFLDCVQSGQMNQFRHRYRHVDVLVIDDIHILTNRERTQEEFFHTFNALYQSNRQIVLSSDSPPSEIPQLEERLISRFSWGLVADITRPDYETRVAIVRAKAKLRGLLLPDDVVSYVATRIESNARELEGAITTLQGHIALRNRPIDLALAQEVMGEHAGGNRSPQITLQQVINAVTEYFNVRLSDLQSKRRHKSITWPRQVCMWLARRHTRFSLEEIGGYFGGRDHTTVMHSIRIVEQHLQDTPDFSKQIEQIEQLILATNGATATDRSAE